MISRPLFKQSCRENAGIWTFVTVITCAMLAIIIMVLGNLNVSTIRSSMTDMFISDAIESTISEKSMVFYNLTNTAISNYDENFNQLNDVFNNKMKDTRHTIINLYQVMVSGGRTDEDAREFINQNLSTDEEKMAVNVLLDYYLVQGEDFSEKKISEYVMNKISDTIYSEILKENDEDAAKTAQGFIKTAINAYLDQKNDVNLTNFATNYIPTVLQNVFYEQEFEYNGDTIRFSDYFKKEEIFEKSYSSIVLFKAQLEAKRQQILTEHPDYSEDAINKELEQYSNSIIEENSASLIEDLPQEVSDALMEISELDVYGLVIGSIFYRIAGLLLPMIFVIMASNNLMAGQVDSGSMAFILSTPIKRRKVAVTQMFYLVISLVCMFLLTTLTSVVSLACVHSSEIDITYTQILWLNLGAFLSMFAVSGICFFCSCWFNRSKLSMSCGGGLTMFFLVATILGLFGSSVIPSAIRIEAMKYFNYCTIISLFDATSILSGSVTFLWKFAILVLIGIITYTVGIIKFNKKDLPL